MPRHRFSTILVLSILLPTAYGQFDAKRVYELAKDAVVRVETHSGVGTGFLYKKGNLVATCYHVVEGEANIVVTFGDKKSARPKAIWTDPAADLAVLQLDETLAAKPLPIGNYESTGPGDNIVVIGNPLGFLTQSLTTGVVSARRSLKGIELLQISAPVSEGSSGSPVLDDHGRVVGVVSFTFAGGDAANMAIGAPALEKLLAKAPTPIETFYKAARDGDETSEGFEGLPIGDVTAETAGTPAFALYFDRLWGRVLRWELDWERLSRSSAQRESDALATDAKKVATTLPDELARALVSGSSNHEEDLATLIDHIDSVNEAAMTVLECEQSVLDGSAEDRSEKLSAVGESRVKLGKAIQDVYSWISEQKWFKAEEFFDKASPPLLVRAFWPNLVPAYPDPDWPKKATIGLSLDKELRDGDVITGIRASSSEGWRPVGTWMDLQKSVAAYGPGLHPMELLIERGSGKYIVRITASN